MPARIQSLKRYQRRRRSGRFDDLPPAQRATAEAHYQRLCARWGDNLPQWRPAILVGRAKDLVLHPRSAAWARNLRNRRQPQPVAPAPLPPAVAPPVESRAVTAAPEPPPSPLHRPRLQPASVPVDPPPPQQQFLR